MLALIAFIVAVLFISDAKDEQTTYDRKVQIQKEYNTNQNSKYPQFFIPTVPAGN